MPKGVAGRLVLDGGTVPLDTMELARELGSSLQENTPPEGISVGGPVEHGRYPYRGFFDGRTLVSAGLKTGTAISF